MQHFVELYNQVSSSTKTNDKLDAIADYLRVAPPEDKAWTLALFTGRRPKRSVNSTKLHEWCAEICDLPLWLFEETYNTVGDLSETIALILPQSNSVSDKPLSYWLLYLLDLQDKTEAEKKEAIINAWQQLGTDERFLFNKLMSGSFRIGVSQAMLVNAIAKVYQADPQVITHRISGNWDPREIDFEDLVQGKYVNSDASKPYPFYLSYALEDEPGSLGEPHEWSAEWKWDGIRGQIIKRITELFVWSRGEELMTEKFPEYDKLKELLPDGTALDGEILPYKDGFPLSFHSLQTRIGRKNVTKKVLQDAPVIFLAYDIMEHNGVDCRNVPFEERRKLLEQVVAVAKAEDMRRKSANPVDFTDKPFVIDLSPVIRFNNWQELIEKRLQARSLGSEGLMLKKKNSIYQAGRRRGDWWKWKVDPLTVDCVLIAAQKGAGRRANLYTDYTFAIRNGEDLLTLTKAYSGLTDKEFVEVDAFIKKNIIEKFGPVRTVKAELVFEIGFEGIAESKRHKSGVALRFPRMLRWRRDKTINDIDTLDNVRALLKLYGSALEEEPPK
jgi:DNA ligase-1